MAFENIPTYKAWEIEHRAREFLTGTLAEELAVPVDVELILERLPGVSFDLWPSLRSNHCTEGMVAFDPETGGICVFVDEQLADNSPNRYRMTVAEELGHVVLHRSVIEQVRTPKDFLELQRHELWHTMDRNAKRFAAAVLMPGDFVLERARELYPQFVRAVGFNNPAAILGKMAAKIALKFEVSPEAMRFRFNE